VSHGQCVAIANTRAAEEMKNTSQYIPLERLLSSISKILGKNKAGTSFLITKQKQFVAGVNQQSFYYFRRLFFFNSGEFKVS
jgi:hypothetical protein